MKCVGAMDVGGTGTGVALVSAEGRILEQGYVNTGENCDPKVMFKAAADLLIEMMSKHQVRDEDLLGVGVGVPGAIDAENGICVYSNNLNWFDINVTAMLGEHFKGKKICIDNDANAAAYGELKFGAGIGCKDFILITLGTGVGSGIIVNGQMMRGCNGFAGEIGHHTILTEGVVCTCGNDGCFESYASATAIIRFGNEEKAKQSCADPKCPLCATQSISAKNVFDAYAQGCAPAYRAFDLFMYYLACGISNVINVFQPEKLAIGGGISAQGEWLIAKLREKVAPRLFSKYGNKQSEICLAYLKNDAGIMGAAALVL